MTKIKFFLYLIATLLANFIFSLSINNNIFTEIDVIGNDEYEIYSIVLLQTIVLPPNPKLFVINQLTSDQIKLDNSRIAYFEERTTEKLDMTTIDDFNKKNAKTYKLENKFSIPQRVVLISMQELKKIFRDGKGWERFYKKFPDASGTTEVSRVGFNKDRTQAILYIGRQSDWLAGAGYLVPLLKEGGKWVVKKEVLVWIS